MVVGDADPSDDDGGCAAGRVGRTTEDRRQRDPPMARAIRIRRPVARMVVCPVHGVAPRSIVGPGSGRVDGLLGRVIGGPGRTPPRRRVVGPYRFPCHRRRGPDRPAGAWPCGRPAPRRVAPLGRRNREIGSRARRKHPSHRRRRPGRGRRPGASRSDVRSSERALRLGRRSASTRYPTAPLAARSPRRRTRPV